MKSFIVFGLFLQVVVWAVFAGAAKVYKDEWYFGNILMVLLNIAMILAVIV